MHAKYGTNCYYSKINAYLRSLIPGSTPSGKWLKSSVISPFFHCFCFIIFTKYLRVALDTTPSPFYLVPLYIFAGLIYEANVICRTRKIQWTIRHKVSLSILENEFCQGVKSFSEWCPCQYMLLSRKQLMIDSAYWELILAQVLLEVLALNLLIEFPSSSNAVFTLTLQARKWDTKRSSDWFKVTQVKKTDLGSCLQSPWT